MKSQPLVSVGIPTYNRPEGLKRLLNCMINQTYNNLEIIVSDNCSSKPEVKKILHEFAKKDKRISYYIQEVNKGSSYNFNFVKEKACGDYFMWAADDDWFDTDYIYECLNFLLNNKNYSIVSGSVKFYDINNLYIHSGEIIHLDSNHPLKRITEYFKNVTYNSIFYGLMPISHAKEIIHEHRLADDWIIISKLLFMGKGKILEHISSHRTSGISASLEKLKEYYGMSKLNGKNYYLFILKIVISDFLNNDFYKKRIPMWKRLYYSFFIASTVLLRNFKNLKIIKRFKLFRSS